MTGGVIAERFEFVACHAVRVIEYARFVEFFAVAKLISSKTQRLAGMRCRLAIEDERPG